MDEWRGCEQRGEKGRGGVKENQSLCLFSSLHCQMALWGCLSFLGSWYLCDVRACGSGGCGGGACKGGLEGISQGRQKGNTDNHNAIAPPTNTLGDIRL